MEEFISNKILKQLPEPPQIAVILGSGLSNFSDNLEKRIIIPYSKIEGYPQPSIRGHLGEFVFGYSCNIPVICARGRFHFYEGHPLNIVTLPIRVFSDLGCEYVIITNAAGCLREEWNLGELMLVNGHMDYTFSHGNRTPRVISGTEYHDAGLIGRTKQISKMNGMTVREGIYCWTMGPSFETPAEIKEIKKLGGDAVGMSTVPEIRQAHDLKLKTLGISCLTNYAAGITNQPLCHAEVLETTNRIKDEFASLIMGIITSI